MLLFKRKRMPQELSDGAPPGTLAHCNDSGWMDKDSFLIWLKHFIQHVKPSNDNKILIVLDGHKSHTLNLEVINLANENCITILSLPPHTTHKLQPLDKAFFKPLQTYYDSAVQKWLRNHPGRSVGMFQVATLFSEAYLKAATMPTAINGFRACGIYPCSRDIFQDYEFAPSFCLPHPNSTQQLPPVTSPSHVSRLPVTQQPSEQSSHTSTSLHRAAHVHQLCGPPQSATQSSQLAGPPPSSIQSRQLAGSPPPAAQSRQLAGPPPSSTQSRQLAGSPASSTQSHQLAGSPPPAAQSRQLAGPPPSSTQSRQLAGPPPSSTQSHQLAGSPPPAAQSRQLAGPPPSSTQSRQLAGSPPPAAQSSQQFRFSENFRTVEVSGDGRCFFRAVAISLDPSLQNFDRVNGCPISDVDNLSEQIRADALRNSLVQHMLGKIESLEERMIEGMLNADMPAHIKFSSIFERISAMAKPSTMVGELEICETAQCIQKTIVIYTEHGSKLTYYAGNDSCIDADAVSLKYTQFGDNCGHYECLLPTQLGLINPLHLPQLPTDYDKNKRNSKKTHSEIITSSPYKRFLEEKISPEPKKIKISKVPSKNAKAQSSKVAKGGKSQTRQAKSSVVSQKKSSLDSWYCFMCGECRKETMICCRDCKRWAHVDCAGTEDSQYICELCL